MFSPILRHSRGLCILALITAALLIACEGGAGPSAPSAAEESATGAPQTPTPETTLTPEAASATILTPTPTPPPPTIPAQVQTPVPAQTRVATSPETDRQALIAIYEALGGAEWNDSSNWLSGEGLAEWYGVATDARGRVVALQLSGNNLVGELPDELWELTELGALRFSDNPGIEGGLPSGIGRLVRLEYLSVRNTGLSGELPVEMEKLVNLPDTTDRITQFAADHGVGWGIRLGILETGLCVPPELEEALHSKLSYGENYYGVLCEERERLAAVYEALGGGEWNDSSNWLSGEGLAEWYGVATDARGRVVALQLSGNNLVGELPDELWELTELGALRFSDNPGIEGGLPSGIGRLVRLEYLSVRNTGLSGELPVEMEKLVNLPDTTDRITQFAADHGVGWGIRLGILETGLCVPPELEEALHSKLSYGENYYGVLCEERERLAAVYEALGGGEWNDSSNWLSGEGLAEWYGVATDARGRVVALQLSGNNLVGELPDELWELTELGALRFSDNPGIEGGLPSGIGRLVRLEYLSVRNTGLSGELPAEMEKLVNLPDTTDRITQFAADHGVGWRVRLGIRETGLCVPPELEEALHSKLSYRENYYGVLCEERERLAGTGTGPQTPVATPAPPGQPGIHGGDRVALVALYNSTGGSSWKDKTNWLSRKPLSEWHGVTTNDEGRVIYLDLSNNGLSSEIPSRLGSLSRLRNLNLSGNDLTGPIPGGLGRLTELKGLNLTDNQLSGSIPRELGQLSSLVSLQLKMKGDGNEFDPSTCVPHALNKPGMTVSAGNPPYCQSDVERRAIEVQKGIKADREALVALYRSTSDTKWDDNLDEIREKFAAKNMDGWSGNCYFGENGPEDLSRWCGVTVTTTAASSSLILAESEN